MSKKPDGGPAFPAPGYIQQGMTLRDYSAIHANISGEMRAESAAKLVGRMPPEDFIESIAYWNEVGAKLAYMYADAMLAEREK